MVDIDMNEINAFFTTGVSGAVTQLVLRVLFEIIIFIIGVQLIKIIRKLLKKSLEKAKAEAGVVSFVDSFVKAALYIVLVFLIASNLGMDAASIVALLGSAGVAIGLAVQGSLSNLAGGVLILLLKPFRVGDYIIENSGKEGFVKEIQIFYTKLLTVDNKTIILPNGSLANNSIINVSTEKERRVDVTVSISYGADIKKAKDVLYKVLEDEACRIQGKDITVFVDELAESSVNIGLRCWVKNVDYWTAKWSITENCKLELDKAGIEIPFPQMDLHIKDQKGMN